MNWTLALPEIVLACCGMGVLMVGVSRKKSENTLLCTMLVLGAFLLAAALVLGSQMGSGYHGTFTVDAFARFAKLLILVGAAFACILSLDFNEREGIARFEFPVLILFAVTGMMVMVSATNMMTLYLGLELQSLSIYVLAAFARDNLRSSEAGLKYFVLGALASGLLLYGSSLVYGFTGTMQFSGIAQALADPAKASTGAIIGVVFVVAALAFKLSAVPFHMWTPDVYEGAPTSVTAFLGTAPKVAAIMLLLRVLVGPFGHLIGQWQQLIVLISIASMLLGARAAIGQTNIKRLMAYSSIGHMGFALIGLAAGTQDGIRGVLVYMITYVFMSAGAFACIIAMRKKGHAVEKISDLAGLGKADPALALGFAIFMFSMAGIPPLAGFFGKLYVFLAAVQSGLWTLAVLGVLTSVIGAFYYLWVLKVVFFDAVQAGAAEVFDRRAPSLSFVAVAAGIFTLVFFAVPGPFVAAAHNAAKSLF